MRWVGVAQAQLGSDYHLIEEGLNGRTTVWEDPIEDHRNGKTYLLPCLRSHMPLDMVVMMLGSNDLKHRFNLSAYDIAAGAGKLVDMIQSSDTGRDGNAPQVLLLSPPPLGEMPERFRDMFADAHEKSAQLVAHYQRVATEMGCHFLDTSFLSADPADGLHLTADAQRQLGERVAQQLQKLFS